ncbi:MAG TPA: efflux RND transporter periplasmic adaptor subunit [Candidatus Paceibacterota bacterium]
MKSRIQSLTKHLKKKKIYIPLALLLIFGAFSVFGGKGDVAEEIYAVEPATFVQEVAVTGQVVAAKDANMTFESTGRVARINVKVGDEVRAGQVLASLSNGDAAAAVAQRQARADSQAARLAEVRTGSRTEDVNIAQAEFDGAVIAYGQSLQSLVDEIKDTYSKSDDAIRSKVDQLYRNPRTVTPEIISFDNYTLAVSLNAKRLRAGEILAEWSKSVMPLTVDTYSASYLNEARTNLAFMRDFMNDLSTAVSAIEASSAIPQSTIDKYRSDISSARSTIGASFSALTAAEQSYKSALTTKQTKEQQLALKKSGSTSQQIAQQQAEYRSALADVQAAQAALAKTLIVAPFDGVITKVDIKVGESSPVGSSALSLISSSGFEIESFISENDISKVMIGQPARVTLDAYGSDVVFSAAVSQVDPSETIKDGVSTYKTKLQFTQNDDRIRSGMTANTVIQTAEKPASVIIPQEALFLEGGEKVVTVDEAGKRVNRKVVTGGINTQGKIEVLEGLLVGDRVVIKKK